MAITPPPNTALTFRLRDGRTLGYAEYGDPVGKPVFLFHGFPGSRLEAAWGHDAAANRGARLIGIDRPGYGLSEYNPGRTFLDWPGDVVELAAALGLERFAVAGISGGGPYAAACAYAIPRRLTRACIVSGLGPLDAPGATDGMCGQSRILYALGRYASWLGGLAIRAMERAARNPSVRFVDRMAASMPEPDRAILREPGVGAILLADVREAFLQGARGGIHELRMYTRPWRFRLEDIAMPVHLWQGSVDRRVPPSMGRYQASAIPDCHATFLEGEGHFLGIAHIGEILAVAVG